MMRSPCGKGVFATGASAKARASKQQPGALQKEKEARSAKRRQNIAKKRAAAEDARNTKRVRPGRDEDEKLDRVIKWNFFDYPREAFEQADASGEGITDKMRALYTAGNGTVRSADACLIRLQFPQPGFPDDVLFRPLPAFATDRF